MIIIRLLRLLFGYTCFTAVGGFPDRFFSLCAENNLSLSAIEYTDSGISAVCYGTNAPRALEYARSAGMTAEVIDRRGLPSLIRRYRHRLGIPVGIILSFILFSLWSSIIWSVSVSGNERVPEQKLLTLLEENGIERGTFRNTVNCDEVEDAIMEAVPELSWISVNIKGCAAEIEVTEMLEAPEILDKNRYVNIVAANDGEILSADVLAGKGSIKVGLPVRKGDLLVNGVVTLKNGGVRFVHSQAVVIARTNYSTQASQKSVAAFSFIENEKNIYSVYLFGVRIPFGFAGKYDSAYECEYILNAGKTQFPLSLIRKRCSVISEKEIELSEQQTKLLCAVKYPAEEEKSFDARDIETRTVSFEAAENGITMSGSCYCHEDIALEQVFEVETAK